MLFSFIRENKNQVNYAHKGFHELGMPKQACRILLVLRFDSMESQWLKEWSYQIVLMNGNFKLIVVMSKNKNQLNLLIWH